MKKIIEKNLLISNISLNEVYFFIFLKERKIKKENGISFSNKTYITIEFFMILTNLFNFARTQNSKIFIFSYAVR